MVKPYRRKTGYVRGHTRVSKERHGTVKLEDLKSFAKIIQDNMGYLVSVAKDIARSHSLPLGFDAGQPIGDFADVMSAGKHGMIMGAIEWKRNRNPKVSQLTQMKTRAKQYMRKVAKQLRGTVDIPRDATKHLTILYHAREKYRQAHGGKEPSSKELADMVTLYRRTKASKPVKLTRKDKIHRIKDLETVNQAQFSERLDIQTRAGEEDIAFWTRYTYGQRKIRQKVNEAIDELVRKKKLTSDQRDIIYLRFYMDKPGSSMGNKLRGFQTIANILNEKKGLTKIKIRKKIGDSVAIKKKGRKVPIRGKIIEITRKPKMAKQTGLFGTGKIPVSYVIDAQGKKTRIPGKPPLKRIKMIIEKDVREKYNEAVEVLRPKLEPLRPLLKSIDPLSKSLDWILNNMVVIDTSIPQREQPQMLR